MIVFVLRLTMLLLPSAEYRAVEYLLPATCYLLLVRPTYNIVVYEFLLF